MSLPMTPVPSPSGFLERKPSFSLSVSTSKNSGEEPKSLGMCLAFGHHWHWTEVYFILVFIAGVALTVLSFIGGGIVPNAVIIVLSLFSCVVAFAHVWNLCTTRRIAMATNTIAQSIKVIHEQNKIASANCDVLTDRNVEFKGSLAVLETSRQILGKSVVNLEGINDKQAALMEELEQIVERRQAFNAKLRQLLDGESKNAAVQTKINLRELVLSAVYAHEGGDDEMADDEDCALVPAQDSGDAPVGNVWTPEHMAALKVELARERIDWDDDLNDALIEGDYVTQFQLYSILEPVLDTHFARVSEDYVRMKELEAEIPRLHLAMDRERSRFRDRKHAAQEKKLQRFYRDQQRGAGEDEDIALALEEGLL